MKQKFPTPDILKDINPKRILIDGFVTRIGRNKKTVVPDFQKMWKVEGGLYCYFQRHGISDNLKVHYWANGELEFICRSQLQRNAAFEYLTKHRKCRVGAVRPTFEPKVELSL